MKPGNRPPDPRCALGRVVESEHDVLAIKRDLFYRQRHLWIELDDPTLTPEQRNDALYLGNSIYPKERA